VFPLSPCDDARVSYKNSTNEAFKTRVFKGLDIVFRLYFGFYSFAGAKI